MIKTVEVSALDLAVLLDWALDSVGTSEGTKGKLITDPDLPGFREAYFALDHALHCAISLGRGGRHV